jgi:predicted helicase
MSKGKPPATEPHSGPPTKQTIHTILAQCREEATSNRDLGDRFERLICRYLELDRMYVDRFSRVWMCNEFPRKGAVGDAGVEDLCATFPPGSARHFDNLLRQAD